MARTRSDRVKEIKDRLQKRLAQGVHRPGDRFPSTREVAASFGISYQTAHRLVQELAAEGHLDRRPASGTYLPGGEAVPEGVQLIFNARGRRPQSFGARLLADLTQRLDRDRVKWKLTWWSGSEVRFTRDRFPVIWECAPAAGVCHRLQRPGLLLNDRPQPGLHATLLDSISIDDFCGGVCAAQLLLGDKPPKKKARFAVLSGPAQDARSKDRRDGFLSLIPTAPVVEAQSWFLEDGYRVAAEALRLGSDGLFCCNDRLAQAVTTYCHDHTLACPRLIGFDDAPVAEQLNLTTIAIPWDEVIAGAADLIKRRLAGDTSTARQLILTPRPVIRKL